MNDNELRETTRDSNKQNYQHDGLVKSYLTEPLAALEFAKENLPDKIKNMVDFSTLRVEKESFVENNLKRQLSDIIYSLKRKDNKEKIYNYIICEHQSSIDNFITFRMWKYILLLCERHLNDKGTLPLVFPTILYTGKKKYTAPRNLWELFEEPVIAKKILTDDFKVIDLQAKSDNEIAQGEHLALLEFIMKHIGIRDMLNLWELLFKKLSYQVGLDKEQDFFYIKKLLCYSEVKISEEKKEKLSKLILKNLPNKKGEELMRTIADSYRDEGKEKWLSKGIEQGMEQGIERGDRTRVIKVAIKMLKKKMLLEDIIELTELSKDEVFKIKKHAKI